MLRGAGRPLARCGVCLLLGGVRAPGATDESGQLCAPAGQPLDFAGEELGGLRLWLGHAPAAEAQQLPEAAFAPARPQRGPQGLELVARVSLLRLPLALGFNDDARAHAWLLRHPLRLEVDGVPSACSALCRAGAVSVGVELFGGTHHLLLTTAAAAGENGAGQRLVLLSREVEVPS